MCVKNCPYCGVTGCRFVKWGKTKQKKVRYRCPECKKTFTKRTGTIRHRSHLSDSEWHQIARMASTRSCLSGSDLGRYLGRHPKTGQKALKKLRGCIPPAQGGNLLEGVVEFDESLMQKQWVVGGMSRTTGKLKLCATPERSGKTLRNIVDGFSAYNATILTDEWGGYNLIKYDRPHYTVNHSQTFVHPHCSQIHTQSIEGVWGRAKPLAKHTHRGYHDLQSFLKLTCFFHNFSHYERTQFLLTSSFPHFTNTRCS